MVQWLHGLRQILFKFHAPSWNFFIDVGRSLKSGPLKILKYQFPWFYNALCLGNLGI